MRQKIAIVTAILILTAYCLVESKDTIDYYSKLYDDLFSAYKKEVGPFIITTAKDGGNPVVTVELKLNLLSVEHLVCLGKIFG